MKYTTEELTPCKKKVNISVEPDEVNAAINTAVKLQQRGIAMDGFRKGHVPADIIEMPPAKACTLYPVTL